jgi:hypothetical protein
MVATTSGDQRPAPISGASVRPYQPPGYWSHSISPCGSIKTTTASLYRRGLYTLVPFYPSLLAPQPRKCTAEPFRHAAAAPVPGSIYVEAGGAGHPHRARGGHADGAYRLGLPPRALAGPRRPMSSKLAELR